jgi:hypothetical protein
MKRAAVFAFILSFAATAIAQLTSGVVFTSGQPFPIVGDFNGDGLDDLIQEKNVLINNGTAQPEVRDLALGDEKVVGVLDANGDHRLDLLTVGTPVLVPANLPQPPMQAPGYRLYLADSAGRYRTAIPISSGVRPYVADVDGDGKDDFVLLADVRTNGITTATEVTVLRSRGDGTFEPLAPFRIAAMPQIVPDHRVLSGDVNHDGQTDLIIRCAEDLVVLLGTGGGSFVVKNYYLPSTPSFGTQSARLGDIDGDSNLDVVVPALRGIRVLFGDGHGNFPRTTLATIARVHPLELPHDLAFITPPANINDPRDLALGHFTRGDRTQIAAGTLEGDIVVFSYEQGALQEVSRTRTEFWYVDLRAGHFRGAADDVYAVGTLIWGETYPRPRLFYGSLASSNANSANAAGRRRASGAAGPELALQMQITGECVDEAAGHWRFDRDGVFGLARRGATTIEAVFDAPQIYFRLSAPYAQGPAYVVLTGENGSYSGTGEVVTACGRKVLTVNAKLD